MSAGLLHLTDRGDDRRIANADSLTIAEILGDLGSGGSLADWYLPYSPYIVPEWLIYGAVSLLSGNEDIRLAGFVVMQLAIMMAATASISRSLTGTYQWGATAAVAAVTVLGATLAVRPIVYVVVPFHHFGTFAVMIWLVALTLRYLIGAGRRWLILALVLSAALVISDRIIAVWFHAPAAVSVAVWGWRHHRREALVWLMSHTSVALAALPVAALIRSRESPYDLVLADSSPRVAVARLVRSYLDNGREAGWWFWITLSILPIVVLLLARGRTALGTTRLQPDARLFLAVFVPASAVSTTVAQLLLGGAVGPNPRYNMTILILPLLLLAGLVVPRKPTIGHRAMLAVPVAGILLWAITALDEIDTEVPDHLACVADQLQASGSRNGVASYWDARDLVVRLDDPGVLDGADVAVGTYDLFGRPERINVTHSSYRDRYDFVVSSDWVPGWEVDLNTIAAANGPPSAIVDCGTHTLWDYGPGGLTMNPFDEPGDAVSYDGCRLGTQVGVVDPARCVISTTDRAGVLSQGPYQALPPGDYELELTYRAHGDGPVGLWDVAVLHQHGAAPTIERQGELSGTNGRIARIEAEWTAVDDPQGRQGVVEIRTSVGAAARAEIISATINRLD